MSEPAGAALITGAAKRLGAAMAMAVAGTGRDVALHCHRSREEAEALAKRIRGLGRRAVVVSGDLAQEAEAARVVPEAAQAIGPLGVLVNNASTFELDHLATADRISWDRHLETNLRAPIVLSQEFVRQLPLGGHGLIVNLLDQRVIESHAQLPVLQHLEGGPVGGDPGARPRAGAPSPRQRHRSGSGAAVAGAGASPLRGAVPGDAAAARHQPGRDSGGAALHHGEPVHDRPADRPGRRPAARLADAASARDRLISTGQDLAAAGFARTVRKSISARRTPESTKVMWVMTFHIRSSLLI